IEEAGREPPSAGELMERFGADTVALLKHLERVGQLVQVEEDRWYARGVVDVMVSALRVGMVAGTEYGPAELREIVGGTRKFLIPFLEFCDRNGVTERRVNGRVLGSAVRRV
ncbi:MAG: SelB C-terminal domain-containing protein, partial [Gemmatimonadota bacterium]|nr:SelB C-terminal domain-containing protein [Gemmatimonadota bacterium]